LRKFNGFEFDKDSDDYKKRLEEIEKHEVAKLKQTAEILNIEKPGEAKEELAKSILDFLLKPTGKTIAEEQEEQGGDEEEIDEEEAEAEEEEIESEEEEKPKKSSSRRGAAAKERDSKGGRPKRATAGRGFSKGSLLFQYLYAYSKNLQLLE
jgi:protein DEK